MNCLPTQFPERAKPSAGTGTQKSIQLSPVLKKPPLHGRDGSSMSYGVGVEVQTTCGEGWHSVWLGWWESFCKETTLFPGVHGPSATSQGSPRARRGLLQVSVPGLPRGMVEPGFSHSPDLPSPPHLPLSLSSSPPLSPSFSHTAVLFSESRDPPPSP